MSVLTEQQTVIDLIADAVESTSEPRSEDIAADLVYRLDPDQLQELAKDALDREVRSYLRALKSISADTGRAEEAAGVPRSTRWDTVRRDAESGQLDLARLTVETGAEAKPLLDCMYGDLADASENHLRFAMANEVFAEQYRKLADRLLDDDNARTVRDLPEHEVRRILSA